MKCRKKSIDGIEWNIIRKLSIDGSNWNKQIHRWIRVEQKVAINTFMNKRYIGIEHIPRHKTTVDRFVPLHIAYV